MAENKITSKSFASIKASINIELSEIEARALLEMTKYGHEAFIKGFYHYLGKAYIKPYESGIISLFKTLKEELPPHLRRFEKIAEKIQEIDKIQKV